MIEQPISELNNKVAIIKENFKIPSFVSRIKPSTQMLSYLQKSDSEIQFMIDQELNEGDLYYFTAEGLEQKLTDF